MKNRPPTISKISPRGIGNVLRRERLFTLFDRQPPTRSFWISGPGGSGKTTLIASYLAERKIPHLWYAVDATDGDPVTFFSYFGQAVASLIKSPACQKPLLPLLSPDHLSGLETFFFRYFETLYQLIPPATWFIFDNFQNAPEESPLLKIIVSAIKLLPENFAIAVVSRNEPPAAVSRFIANRTMQAIGGKLIRFTREEFAAFLTLTRPDLGQNAGKRLHKVTKGWIAGNILWLSQVKGETNPRMFTTERVPQSIFDYFIAEVLEKISCSLYHFLLRSAHLPYMTVDMAGDLTDMAAADILQTLIRKNCFIEKCCSPNATNPIYWYQPLFRQFLLVTAARVYPATSRREMYCRAAGILKTNGWKKQAIDLYIQAGANDSAASIIIDVAPSFIAKGREAMLSQWIELLPCEYSQKNPWLLLWHGQAQMTRNAPRSLTLCTMAFNSFYNNSDITGQILSWASAVEIIFMVRSGFTDLDLCIAAGERLADLLPAAVDTADLTGRFAASMLLALLLFDLGHPDLEKWQERCEVLLERCNNLHITADLMKNLFYSYQWLGQVHKARFMEERLQLSGNIGKVQPLVQVTLHYTTALAAAITGDQRLCRKKAVEALNLADKTGIHIHDTMMLVQDACTLLAAGELGEVETTLKKMQETLLPFAIWDQGNYHFLRAWHAMQCGKMLIARNETAIASMLLERCDNPFTIALSRILQSQLLLELGETDKVECLLTNVIKEQRLRKSRAMHFIGQLSLADCAASAHQEEKARQHLCAAFSIARQHGLSLPFGLSSRRLANLCRKALEAGIEVDTVKEVIKRFRLCPLQAKTVSDLWPWPVRIYTLGRFAIHCHGKPSRSSSKPQRKPLELLIFIISGGEKSVSRDAVSSRLWPDTDGDRAVQNLNTTLHRLRRLLGSEEAVVLCNGQLILNSHFCWIDAHHFAWLVRQIDIPPTSPAKKNYLTRALQMYQGPFMAGYEQMPVATSYREQLERLWHHTLAAALPLFVEITSAHQNVLKQALAVDDTAAPVLQLFFSTFSKKAGKTEACGIIQRCETLLAEQGIRFSGKTEALLQHLFPSRS